MAKKKIETNLDDVLQSPIIFTNVSKGVAAKKQDLKRSFKTTNEDEIRKTILNEGQVQVTGIERKQEYETLLKDIATIVAEKCVNPETNRALTVGLVEKAMRDIHYSVNPSQSAKKQALIVIKRLKDEKPDFPIARANMRLKFCFEEGVDLEAIKEKLKEYIVVVEEESKLGDKVEIVGQINPSNYRLIDKIIRESAAGKGTIEVVSLSCHVQGTKKIT